jgi:hypothetical protein
MISIHPKQGTYIASPTQLAFTQKALVLKTGTIQVGEKTDLHGWFCEPLEFMGFHGDEHDEAIFYMGKTLGGKIQMFGCMNMKSLNINK